MARDRRLQRLRRDELLQILLELEQENEQLSDQNALYERQFEERKVAIDEAGTLAEAALKLSGVFAASQEAADLYLHNVELLCERRRAQSAELLASTREACLELARQTDEICAQVAGGATPSPTAEQRVRELLNAATPVEEDTTAAGEPATAVSGATAAGEPVTAVSGATDGDAS